MNNINPETNVLNIAKALAYLESYKITKLDDDLAMAEGILMQLDDAQPVVPSQRDWCIAYAMRDWYRSQFPERDFMLETADIISIIKSVNVAALPLPIAQEVAAKQAIIDRLMLEFCPDEMTAPQMAAWAASQRCTSAPAVAQDARVELQDVDGIPAKWISEVCGPSVDDLSYGHGYRQGFNDCRTKVIAARSAPSVASTGTLPPLPELDSAPDIDYLKGADTRWDADYLSMWTKVQVLSRNAMQWRKHALEVRALFGAPSVAVTQDAQDAARYRWITDDIANSYERSHRNRIIENMAVKSYSCMSLDVDLAMQEYGIPQFSNAATAQEKPIQKGAAIDGDGTTYHGIAEIYHRMEEGEALHMWLDGQKIARVDPVGPIYSLVGRVQKLIDQCTTPSLPVVAPADAMQEVLQGIVNDGYLSETMANRARAILVALKVLP